MQQLLLLRPQISLLIDEFGLMLKDEYDERSYLASECYKCVFRRNETIHPDFRDDNPFYRPRNLFEHFWDKSPSELELTQLELF